MLDIRTVRTDGLGDSTYVLAASEIGLVVDPQRDIDRFLPIIEDLGIEIRWVFDTHLHNDYISGARDLAAALGAELVLPAGAAPSYRHTPSFHREELEHGGLVVRPLHTPGHTPEHMSYEVEHEDDRAVFTGGSLLVGSAGRSDLLGEARARTLARLQHGSLRRLAALPEDTGVFPTHGAGSFCTASTAGGDTSTIGIELRTNPVLAIDDAEAFVTSHLSGLAPYPSFYAHMGKANLEGRPPLDLDTPTPKLAEADYGGLGEEVIVVDGRAKSDFARRHLVGALGIELRKDFGVWVGWVTPMGSPLAVIVEHDSDLDEIRRQLARIGYDDVVGYVDDLDSWSDELMTSYPTHDIARFTERLESGAQLVDSRSPLEWESGVVPGSITAYTPDLVSSIPNGIEPDSPVLVACGTGYRATISASLLERAGHQPEVLVGAGVPEVIDAMN